MTRRDYGSGTIYQRADGLWIGRIEAGTTPTGTRRRITVSAKTEALCRTKLKAKHREILRDGPPIAGGSRATVKSWAGPWLAAHAKQVRPKAYATDASAVRRWIIPTIGHRRLADLTRADVRAVREAITNAGRSTTTALHAHGVLIRMLKAARGEGHHVEPRVIEAPRPGKATNDRDAIPLADALLLLDEAMRYGSGERWAAAFLQGMRQGEVLGLTWDCVDLDRGVIDVSWQRQDLPYLDKQDHSKGFRIPDGFEARHLTGATHLTRPKTARGQRIIPLVDWMHLAFTNLRDRTVPNEWGLVFTMTDTRNGRDKIIPVRPERDRKEWEAIQARAGIAHPSGRPYLIHEIRHTTATILLELKVPDAVIEAIMGHAALVKAYLHASTEQSREALQGVAEKLHLTLPQQIEG